jgi:hypothetical protein
MNIIIYFTDEEVSRINSNKTFWTVLHNVLNQFNHVAHFNMTCITSYSDKSETYVCKQQTNNQCRIYRQDFINLNFLLKAHKIH